MYNTNVVHIHIHIFVFYFILVSLLHQFIKMVNYILVLTFIYPSNIHISSTFIYKQLTRIHNRIRYIAVCLNRKYKFSLMCVYFYLENGKWMWLGARQKAESKINMKLKMKMEMNNWKKYPSSKCSIWKRKTLNIIKEENKFNKIFPTLLVHILWL